MKSMLTGMKLYHLTFAIVLLMMPAVLLQFSCATYSNRPAQPRSPVQELEFIRVSNDGSRFVCAESGAKFVTWGFNYDHDDSGRLIEDYWRQEWPTVAEDFKEMKALGANVVRIHLQIAKFMNTPDKPNGASLAQLARLVKLAEETGLYLDITGLGCYHKKDVPQWYDAMDEARRWDVQALFWEAVAKTCTQSPAVFCYDLMNEPILPGANKKETDWLAGEFAGKHFVQRITLDLAGRTRKVVARAWVDKLVLAIRKHDDRHMITVGVIPWVHTFPKAKPLFYSKQVAENLNFVSVHFYPKKGEVHKALTALSAYDIGKPLVIEEMFPLHCSMDELAVFIDASRKIAEGWIGFYWGKTIEQYDEDADLPSAITKSWLKYFSAKAPQILGSREPKHKQPLIRSSTHPPSQTSIEYPAASIENPAASIENQVLSIEHPVSSIEHPVSSYGSRATSAKPLSSRAQPAEGGRSRGIWPPPRMNLTMCHSCAGRNPF